MIKLQDFARACGVTDRAIQKHIRNHRNELEEHIRRNGNNGTWLDDYAQNYIKGLMKERPAVILDGSQVQKVQELQARIDMLYEHIAKKDAFIDKMIAHSELQQERIERLENQKLLLEERTEKRIIDVKQELEASHKATESILTRENEILREELKQEKERPLTLYERFTGHKKTT